ncbi:MAG: L-serine ammonia-lyase, iron-sulfur-dependent, subunit alpha [Clostridiales bacterium]|nr:L-serine ammonia-lyase, iron-sulfur-dependent, subunit alpha [Clostridiales bacterium]
MDFKNGQELLNLCEEHKSKISEIMREREVSMTEASLEEINKRMEKALRIMQDAVHLPLKKQIKSMGGLIGGEASKLMALRNRGKSIAGTMLSKAITYAMAVLEVNASMGLIVATPTAGSSGVVPGLLLALQEEHDLTDEEIINGLFTAGAIGYIVMRNATVAGAEAGCQAEVGVASAMAAAAATEIMGGTPKQCMDAATTAIMNLLGLVCDPIGGLVEAPCQSRNAMGVSNALTCAEISLSGIEQFIPFDEMVEAMFNVGKKMPVELRETALGGSAMTASACNRCSG